MKKSDSHSDVTLKRAENFLQQGNLVQALKCYRQLEVDQSNDFILQRIRTCLKQLLRKYWRQQKADQMAQVMKDLGVEQELAPAYARLLGKEALNEMATETQGVPAKLAQCSMQENLKAALLSLRQLSELKSVAEGWLALLKGDPERALVSFDQIKEKFPTYAKIGKGMVYLIKGDRKQANAYLEALKPFSSHQFPLLAKEMEWGKETPNKEKMLSYYLFFASLKELQQAESQLSPQQKDTKGWMWIRIGDYLVSKSPNEALVAWDKAKQLNSTLILDTLKRRFLLSCQVDCNIDPARAFRAFYQKLVELTPQEAKEFVEYLCFESQESLAFFEVKDLKNDTKWMVTPPPIELQLLWFHVFYQNNIRTFVNLFFITPDLKKSCIQSSWQEWISVFQPLDVEYGKQEKYLRQKLEVARLYEQEEAVRSIIAQLLPLNAMLKDELLPLYVQKTLSALCAKSITIKKKQEISKEIDRLRHFWTSDYDLIRLSILANISEQEPMDLAATLGIHLSEPLRQVLQLQVAIDQKWGLARCRKFLPHASFYNRDREADWRLLIALSDDKLKFPRKEFENLLSLIAFDTPSKHELFSKMELYGEVVPLSLLKNWNKQEKAWEADYHLALYFRSKQDFNKSLQALETAYHKMPKNAKEYISTEKTLECYLGGPQLRDIPPEFLEWLEELFY